MSHADVHLVVRSRPVDALLVRPLMLMPALPITISIRPIGLDYKAGLVDCE